MDIISLATQARDVARSAKHLRNDSIVPCVLYGHSVENTSLQCDHNEMFRVYTKAGESTLIELEISGKKVPVLVHEITFDPVTERIEHVDFFAVNMKEEIETDVPIHLVNDAPAVKDLGGVLVMSNDHVTVRCLPTKLPHALEIDIAGLTEFGMSVHVSDIVVPEGVVVTDDPELMIASTQEPRRIEVEEEVATEEGEEGEEGTEGEEGDGEESGDADAGSDSE